MIAQYAQAREQHRFDVGALERYLGERVPGFAEPLRGPTVPRRPVESDLPSHRRCPANTSCATSRPASCCPPRTPWTGVPCDHRAGGADVPVPRTYVLCEDDAVMDCVHGRMVSDPALPEATATERTSMCHGGRRGTFPRQSMRNTFPACCASAVTGAASAPARVGQQEAAAVHAGT